MRVSTDKGEFVCQTKQRIDEIIRSSALNPFDDIWISGTSKYPCLAILVNGGYACIHYFQNEKCAGEQSIGHYEADIAFACRGTEFDMPGNAVVSLDEAIACVDFFFDTNQRPDCIKWREL